MNLAYKIALAITAALCGGIILWDLQQHDADAAQPPTSAGHAAQTAQPPNNDQPPAVAPGVPGESDSRSRQSSPGPEPGTTFKPAPAPAPPKITASPSIDNSPEPIDPPTPAAQSVAYDIPTPPNAPPEDEREAISTIAAIAQPPKPTNTPATSTDRADDPDEVPDEDLGSFFTPPTEAAGSRPVAEHVPATYTIQAGDSYSVIAKRIFGRERMWVAIRDANPDIDPRKLKPGQEIRLPDSNNQSASAATRRGNQTPAARSNLSTTASGDATHIIVRGQTLSAIALKHYGDARLWRPIYEANRLTIGNNPDRLPLGVKIIIPKR